MIESLDATINIVAEAYDIPTSIQAVQEYNPDLIFLDIQLKDGTGFDILHHSQQQILSYSYYSHNQYALEAFKVYAVDYLLKPVDKDQLSCRHQSATRNSARSKGTSLAAADQIFKKGSTSYHHIF
jgi:two-component system LytT family response regulator